MSALAVLLCQSNSHPFQDRHISLHEPVKVGRAVARARPVANNAIFDCKVLSRNHALLWYSNGKFFLQDTKSSNGTFINNQRLSKGSEESAPREIFSGDVIQFGVDVMENSRNVTHGCIIATIQLFFPDGRECTASHSSSFLGAGGGATVQSQELYQLAQYLQEALHREQMLESKLAMLQRLLQNTQEASETGWQALIDEDRLLSRLEVLENQLQAYSKNQTEETLRQELSALQEDKYNYETTAKESLRKVLQEKLDAVRKLSELERSLSNTEDECTHLKDMCEISQKELQQLAEKHQEQLTEMTSIQEKLEEAEKQHQEELEQVEKEKAELQEKIDAMLKEEESLSTKVESLQADNDFTKEQLTNMKLRMEAFKEKSESNEDIRIKEVQSQSVQVDLVNMLDLQALQANMDDDEDDECNEDDDNETLRKKLKETKEAIEEYKSRLHESERRLEGSREEVEKLQGQLEQAQIEVIAQVAKISSLEEKLQLSDLHMNQLVENTVADLKTQLGESRKQSENSSELARQLKEEISRLEAELHQLREDADRHNVSHSDTIDVTNSNSISNHVDHTASNHLRQEIDRLKENLQEAWESQRKNELEVERLKRELEESQRQIKKSADETSHLQTQLHDAQRTAKDQTDHASALQDQLNKAESTTQEVKQQILALREQLQEAQLSARQSKNEAEQLKMRVQVLQEELRIKPIEAPIRAVEVCATQASQAQIQKQAAINRGPESLEDQILSGDQNKTDEDRAAERSVEFASLKEECANLRRRIQDIEIEMKIARKENQHLQSEYMRLQESYKELEAMKDKLENNETTWKLNLTDAQKDSDKTKEELKEANQQICVMKDKCSEYREEISQLKGDFVEVHEEFDLLAYRSRTLSTCSMVPLLLLLFAVLLALYPTLASITATGSPT